MAVLWILETSLDPERVGDLRRLAAEMSEVVRAEEPGCLRYDWHLNEEGNRCHILEGYADDAALLSHVEGFNRRWARAFFGLLKPERLVVYGDPGPEARAAIAALRPVYMPSL
ncbi:putative quinol monooxygenase [Pararhodobacter sp.]|uniref:putative quinol monooxygenase n=1 Tax=Pararhodobacter sp. TaxID=2127056 RepID=UPI002AFE4D42|nr:antibiotic biosynthesis monooxygenase [Pararhodobacter sp.]